MENYSLSRNLNTELEFRGLSYAKKVFKDMFSDLALEKANAYLNEERLILEKLVRDTPKTRNMNFCVVGGGPFSYLSLASKYFNKYTLIDPHLHCFMNETFLKSMEKLEKIKCIECIEKSFEDYCQTYSTSFTPTNTFYVFWFNVISYIQNPIEWLNQIVKPGDIVFISKWGSSEIAQKTLKNYFERVNNDDKENNHQVLPALPNLPFGKLYQTSGIRYINQKVTNIIVAYI